MGLGCGLLGPLSVTISTKKSKAEAVCVVGSDLMNNKLGRNLRVVGWA